MVISVISVFHCQVANMVIVMFHLNVFVIQDGMVSSVQNVRSHIIIYIHRNNILNQCLY